MGLYWNDSFFSCLWCSHLLGIAFFLSWCFSAVFVNDEHDERRRQRRTVHRIFFKYYYWESNWWFRGFLLLIQFWLFKDSRRLRLNWINIFLSLSFVFCIVLIRCCCWFSLGNFRLRANNSDNRSVQTIIGSSFSFIYSHRRRVDQKLWYKIGNNRESSSGIRNYSYKLRTWTEFVLPPPPPPTTITESASIFGARNIRTISPRCACALQWIEKRVWRQCRNRTIKDLDSDKIRKIKNS